MQDFLVWFMSILLILTIGFFLFFGVVGGNPVFQDFSSAFNYIGLVTMGFGDYDTLFNNGVGFLGFGNIVTIMFWILVFLCIMFAQNIILATVGKAYDECSENAEGCVAFKNICASRIRYVFMNLIGFEGFHVEEGKRASILALKKVVPQGADSERTLASVQHEIELQERSQRYAKWNQVRNPSFNAVYAYFQHPLRLEPELEYWLWDNGAAVKEADNVLRKRGRGEQLWHDTDWSAKGTSLKASTFLDRLITRSQLHAVLDEVCKVQKLNDIEDGFFAKKSMFRTTGKNAHGSGSNQQPATLWNLDDKQWINRLFDAFKQEVVEASLDNTKDEEPEGDTHVVSATSTKEKQARNTVAAVFFNKRRNLTKTTRSIEDQVLELTKGLRDIHREQQEFKEQVTCQLNKITELLKSK